MSHSPRKTVVALGAYFLQGRNGWGSFRFARRVDAAEYRQLRAAYSAAAWFTVLAIGLAACGGAVPTAQDEAAVAADLAAQHACVTAAKTIQEADACTRVVTRMRPATLQPDGGR